MRPKRGAPTTRRPVLRKLVPEPLTPYDPNRPVETLTQLMAGVPELQGETWRRG
jgi:hypothetical protein